MRAPTKCKKPKKEEEYYTLENMQKFTQRALENGVLLRPIGDTIYWAPPLIITQDEIQILKESTLSSLKYL